MLLISTDDINTMIQDVRDCDYKPVLDEESANVTRKLADQARDTLSRLLADPARNRGVAADAVIAAGRHRRPSRGQRCRSARTRRTQPIAAC
jgi:hypothetical protein